MRGLENSEVDNHCFLNVILQTVFHIGDISGGTKKERRIWGEEGGEKDACSDPANCMKGCIVQLHADYTSKPTTESLSCANVRARLAGAKPMFGGGQMNDVSETLEDLLQGIHGCLGGAADGVCKCDIHKTCSTVMETRWMCRGPECSNKTEGKATYQLLVHNVPVQALKGRCDKGGVGHSLFGSSEMRKVSRRRT